MSILIKIDPDTVKKNENAGATETTIKVGSTTYIEFETIGISEDKIKSVLGEKASITFTRNNLSDREHTINMKAVLLDKNMSDEEIQKLLNPISIQLLITRDNDIQTYRHRPISKFSWKYENTKVKCNSCGKKAMTDDLESDSMGASFDDAYSDQICPHCQTWDCCDIKYQSLSDFRKGINND